MAGARASVKQASVIVDKTPSAPIGIYNRSKLFLAWDGDPSICHPSVCPAGTSPQVINSILQEQETDPN
jgi:hypothetical protein